MATEKVPEEKLTSKSVNPCNTLININ